MQQQIKSLMGNDVACCFAVKQNILIKLTWPDVLKWLPWLLALADQFQKGFIF